MVQSGHLYMKEMSPFSLRSIIITIAIYNIDFISLPFVGCVAHRIKYQCGNNLLQLFIIVCQHMEIVPAVLETKILFSILVLAPRENHPSIS